MANIITPASGLKVGDKNGPMKIVQIGSSNANRVVLDWVLPNGEVFTEVVASDASYMIQRA